MQMLTEGIHMQISIVETYRTKIIFTAISNERCLPYLPIDDRKNV